MSSFGMVLFHTTSSAFRAEKVLKKAGIYCKMVPTPRQFSSDCGIAARFNYTDSDTVESALKAESVEYADIKSCDC